MSRPRNSRGQSSVEFSLVVLVVLMLIFGLFETGRLMLIYTALADGARAATRYAVVHGTNASSPSGGSGQCDPSGGVAAASSVAPNVANQAQNIATAGGLTFLVRVCYNPDNSTGSLVSVTAYYAYTTLASVVPISAFTLSSTSQGAIAY